MIHAEANAMTMGISGIFVFSVGWMLAPKEGTYGWFTVEMEGI